MIDLVVDGVDIWNERPGRIRVEMVDVDIIDEGRATHGLGLEFALAGADYQLMLTPHQSEGAAGEEIIGGLVVVTPLVEHSLPVGRVIVTFQNRPHQLEVRPVFRGPQMQTPVVVETLVELDKERFVVDVLVRPAVAERFGTGEAHVAAVQVHR